MIESAKNLMVENFVAIEIVIEKNYYSHDTRSYQFKKLPVKVADSAEEGFSATIIVRMRNSIQLKKNYKYFVALDKPNSRLVDFEYTEKVEIPENTKNMQNDQIMARELKT